MKFCLYPLPLCLGLGGWAHKITTNSRTLTPPFPALPIAFNHTSDFSVLSERPIMARKKDRKIANETGKSFCENTSIHGFCYWTLPGRISLIKTPKWNNTTSLIRFSPHWEAILGGNGVTWSHICLRHADKCSRRLDQVPNTWDRTKSIARLRRIVMCIGPNQKTQPNLDLYLVQRYKIFVSVATLVNC